MPAASQTASAPARPWAAPEGPVTWEYLCKDPTLDGLPYRIELDQYGRIIMSPISNRHSRRQGRIARVLEDALGGEAYPECAIRTPRGIRSPDVVWMSDTFASSIPDGTLFLETAPEICVEVMSPSNLWAEMEEKVTLYLAKGAQEVWICEPGGTLRFFGHEGERETSALVPGAPAAVTL